MTPDRTKRKLCGILSADVVGYSRLMEEDETWTIEVLETNKKMISALVESYEGRVVDAPGDNLLAEFSSVLNAVECAGKIQQKLKIVNSELLEGRKMEFRIGVNLGEVIEEDGRIYGSGVNIAARLESLAKPGGICISRTAYEQVSSKLDLGYEYLGEHNVKNISEPISVYRVLFEEGDKGKKIKVEKEYRSRAPKSVYILTILLIAVAGIAGWLFFFQKDVNIPASPSKQVLSPAETENSEEEKSIAVLPFIDLSPDKDQEDFVYGLSDEILNSLTQIPDLKVISRTSSFAFKGSNKTIQEIAAILGVNNVLEGSVRKSENKLRIIAKLVHASDSTILWSDTYESNLKDIIRVHENIASNVAEKLKIALGIMPVPRFARNTENPSAYENLLVSQGQTIRKEYGQSLKSSESAISMAPRSAIAWVQKATAHLLIASNVPPDRVSSELNAGLDAAKKAVELQPDLGFAYLPLGNAYAAQGQFIRAEESYKKAIELTKESNRSLEVIMHYTKMGYISRCQKLLADIITIDPLQDLARAAYVLNLGTLGNLEQAEKEYETYKRQFGNKWIYGDINITILRLGSNKQLTMEDIPELPMLNPIWSIGRRNINSPEKGLEELREIYNNNKNLSSNNLIIMSCFAAYFKDPEFAMEVMIKSAELHTSGLYFIWTPVMKDVRQLPEFKEFLRNFKFVEYWNKYGWPDTCRSEGGNRIECR